MLVLGREMINDPWKSKSTKLCPLVGSGILDPWIILTTILCLVLDIQGNDKHVNSFVDQLGTVEKYQDTEM